MAANPDASDSLDGQVYSFECRLAGRQQSRGEPTVYEHVSVSGTFRGPRRRRDWADKSKKKKISIANLKFSYNQMIIKSFPVSNVHGFASI